MDFTKGDLVMSKLSYNHSGFLYHVAFFISIKNYTVGDIYIAFDAFYLLGKMLFCIQTFRIFEVEKNLCGNHVELFVYKT